MSPGAAAFGYTLRAVGARLALALPLVMLATALAVRAHPANRVEGFDTAGWWLHLPTLLLAGLAVTATVDAWPAFGRDRAPAAQITRLRIGALDGCGAAALAGLCGLAPALLLAGVGFAWSEGRASTDVVVDRFTPAPVGDPVLDHVGDRVAFDLGGERAVDRLALRPQAFWAADGSLGTTRVALAIDGAPAGEATVTRPAQLVEIALPEGAAGRHVGVAVVGAPGLDLFLPEGSLTVVGVHRHAAWWNATLAALSTTAIAATALAFACLGRRHLGQPVLLVLAAGVVLAATALDLSANAEAVARHARSEWVGTAAGRAFWSLSAAGAAMLCAVVTGPPNR